ncbi:hypothetical protein D0859_05685 [Hortaea werneckii]|uniref:Uncharacterized protein n=1 Tax=Hortaea werneckii TaxID=91943 RepID=A0A3M7IXJ7_HORWE|nr:hypothetical protein D0859_05685 [Hortaea werneckii]
MRAATAGLPYALPSGGRRSRDVLALWEDSRLDFTPYLDTALISSTIFAVARPTAAIFEPRHRN